MVPEGGAEPDPWFLTLGGVAALAFFALRGAWHKWKVQPSGLRSFGLRGCFGVGIGGWLAVAVMVAIVRATGDSFAMIIVAPLLLVFSTLAGLAGLGAALVGIGVIAAAFNRPTENAVLIALGGAVSIALNIGFIWAMVRMVFR